MAIKPNHDKKKRFIISITGTGIYEKDVELPDGKKTLQLDVVDFFNKTGKDLGDSTIIDALRDYLIQTNPHEVNSLFHVQTLDFLGNDEQPSDIDSIV